MLRIIGGIFRSRKILQPPLANTRPTKDRVRAAIFSAIANNVNGSVVLDLFAGSGAYGFEAISRGAKFAHLNDEDAVVKKVIETNANSLEINNLKVTQMDAFEFLENAILNNLQFDIVFLDPPYAFATIQNLFRLLFKSNLLSPGSVVVYENESKLHAFNEDKLLVKSYNYGRTFVHIGWKK